MTIYSAGTIVFLDYPYSAGGQTKARPALVVLDTGDADVMVARITSQNQASKHDVSLVDWLAAGLRLPSTVRLHKVLTVEKSLIRRTLGVLTPADRKSVAAVLASLFAGW